MPADFGNGGEEMVRNVLLRFQLIFVKIKEVQSPIGFLYKY